MSENIYAPPQSKLDTASVANTLASRWSRLGASFIDGLTIMLITVPTMYYTGGFDDISKGIQPSLEYNLAIAALGFAVFFLLNTKLLLNNGQTVGKLALGIKIVDLDGNLPGLKKHLLKRYSAYFIPSQVPVIGQLFSFINIVFIFGNQKRCVHDYFAGTKVVKT